MTNLPVLQAPPVSELPANSFGYGGVVLPSAAALGALDSFWPLLSNIQSQTNKSFLSARTSQLEHQFAQLKSLPSPAKLTPSVITRSTEASLFDATAAAKIMISQVAMHLDNVWRNKLYYQIDSLHEFDEWDPDDKPLQQHSFYTFLRALLQVRPTRFPGLGLSHDGYILAAWISGENRLAAEFLENDRVQWVLTRQLNGEIERSSSTTTLSRWLQCLEPYNPAEWFYAA